MAGAAGLLYLAAACTGLTGGDSPVAIEFVDPPDTIVVGVPTPVRVRALNRDGDSLPGAPIALVSLTPDTIAADSAQRTVTGLLAGSGRIIARVGALVTEPFRIVARNP